MALGAVLAAALTDHSPRAYALWVGGVDVLKQPGATGNGYGVPLETITVTEVGPGGVSSIAFTVEDPLSLLSPFEAGTEIQFWDLTNDHPDFAGFIQTMTMTPAASGQGRNYAVVGSGFEILLDWTIVVTPGASWPTRLGDAYAQSLDGTQIRAAYTSDSANNSTLAYPMGYVAYATSPVTIPAGSRTLRETLGAYWCGVSPYAIEEHIFYTVDFYRNLRVWDPMDGGVSDQFPDDYTMLVVSDTVGGRACTGLEYTYDYAERVRGVYVIGDVAYGWFYDGRADVPGQRVILNDSTITSSSSARAVALAYMAERQGMVRGSLTIESWNPGPTNYRAGALLELTNAAVGAAPAYNIIGSITKTYQGGGLETWTVNFGGNHQSFANAMRRLTRNVLG